MQNASRRRFGGSSIGLKGETRPRRGVQDTRGGDLTSGKEMDVLPLPYPAGMQPITGKFHQNLFFINFIICL